MPSGSAGPGRRLTPRGGSTARSFEGNSHLDVRCHSRGRRFKDEGSRANSSVRSDTLSRSRSPGRDDSGGSGWDVASLRAALYRKHVTTGQLFSMGDADRSDNLTLMELKRGLAMCGVRPVPSDVEMTHLFESFDLNHDGTLSFKELIDSIGKHPTRRANNQFRRDVSVSASNVTWSDSEKRTHRARSVAVHLICF